MAQLRDFAVRLTIDTGPLQRAMEVLLPVRLAPSTRGPQSPAPFDLGYESHPGYVLIVPRRHMEGAHA